MSDFGLDLSCTDDLDELMGEVSGEELMRQAILRRLTTPRGQLLDDPDYGLDVRGFLSAETPDLSTIPGQIEGELSKDERIGSTTTTVEWDPVKRALAVTVVGNGAAGPFSLTLPISAVTPDLLSGGA